MTRLTLLGFVVMVTAWHPAARGDEPVALFDGKSLAGWEGSKQYFRVQDGAIVGGTLKEAVPRNEFLCTQKNYSDFELRLKVKLVGEDANAGVQFRSRRIPDNHEMIGYQADAGVAWGQTWWGKLYDESRRNKILAAPDDDAVIKEVLKPDDWNELVVRCTGPRIQIWLNERQTVDYTEPDESVEQTGLIGLQIHGGPPAEAWYKDITIKQLSDR